MDAAGGRVAAAASGPGGVAGVAAAGDQQQVRLRAPAVGRAGADGFGQVLEPADPGVGGPVDVLQRVVVAVVGGGALVDPPFGADADLDPLPVVGVVAPLARDRDAAQGRRVGVVGEVVCVTIGTNEQLRRICPRQPGRGSRQEFWISPQLQKREIRSWAKPRGLELEMLPAELDRSGADDSRPILQGAIERIERGELDGVIVWNFARFTRSLVSSVAFLESIEQAGGQLYSTSEQIDATTPAGRMTRNFLFSIAQAERETKAEGFDKAKADAIKRGIWTAPVVPFGYRKNKQRRLEPDPVEGPIRAEVIRRRGGGESWHSLANYIREQTGRSFLPASVRQMVPAAPRSARPARASTSTPTRTSRWSTAPPGRRLRLPSPNRRAASTARRCSAAWSAARAARAVPPPPSATGAATTVAAATTLAATAPNRRRSARR